MSDLIVKDDLSLLAREISEAWGEIYFHAHPTFTIDLSHQSVRALQYVSLTDTPTVGGVAQHLDVRHHTASEIVARLENKGLVRRGRASTDRRHVTLELTAAGTSALSEHTGLDPEAVAEALASASPKDLRAIESAFASLLALVQGPRR
jgi:DNA-binding MarR family transcriptional regulator